MAEIYVLFQNKTGHSNKQLRTTPFHGWGEGMDFIMKLHNTKHYRDKICMLSLQKRATVCMSVILSLWEGIKVENISQF